MKRYGVVVLFVLCASAWCQQSSSAPSLTIYNQDFAVVRESLPLTLKAGINDVSFDRATSFLEPDSVVLRDPAGKVRLGILEQNYRTDVASQYNLLHAYEGKDLDFQIGPGQIVHGRVIRAGSTCNGSGCYYANGGGYTSEPIIEVDGKIEFGLPGKPIFPALQNESLLKPALNWMLQSDRNADVNAEINYVTGGLSWEASYNLVAPENGDLLDLVGWITLQNRSGHTFENAHLQLMAGEINKITRSGLEVTSAAPLMKAMGGNDVSYIPPVTEKAFDEYHLYTLDRPSTLENGETKQVEFLGAIGVPSKRVYVYEGYMLPDSSRGNWSYQSQQPSFGETSNKQVYIMREFRNSEADHLGKPLPAGIIRFYRRDDEGRLQFVGENRIVHTPKDEMLRIYTGNSFDIVAERRQTQFRIDNMQHWIDESYEITLRNHKSEAVKVQVVEHMCRYQNWEITGKSAPYVQKDSNTVEFTAAIPANGEQTVSYTVHYTWW